MSEEIFLTLGTVFSYLNAQVQSRCIIEGEEIINAKHIILLGQTSESKNGLEILAVCLQTSGIKSSPHEIKGCFKIVNKSVHIKPFKCSCKAGMSGTCKHIAAVLLRCTRTNLYSLEQLSSTDIKCYWAAKKKNVEQEYEAKLLLETTCIAGQRQSIVKAQKEPLSTEQQKKCLQMLLTACEESSLALHLAGRSTASKAEKRDKFVDQNIKTVLATAANSQFLENLKMKLKYEQKPCCTKIIDILGNTDVMEPAASSAQTLGIWHQESQYRITGSRCYSLYTYAGDFIAKAKEYFNQKKISNKYIEHGIKFGKEALDKYRNVNNYMVCEAGLIICRQYPWFAYSPDGIVITNGVPTRLVEIKCPYDGIENDAIHFVHSCPYLEVSPENGIRLKRRHSYYEKVQLGMATLNLKVCDFIVYSSKSKTFLNVLVDFDEDFAKNMLSNLTEKYFNYMIQTIC